MVGFFLRHLVKRDTDCATHTTYKLETIYRYNFFSNKQLNKKQQ